MVWDVFRPLHSAWWALFGVPLLAILHGLVQLLAAWPITLSLGPFGLAVIVMTVLVRVVMLPLAGWQVRSSLLARRRAADIQVRLGPEIARLRRRHRRDPRAFQRELTDLLTKHGISPLATLAPGLGSGLVTGLVQMPVLIAFYQVILALAHGGGLDLHFLWIGSLAVPDPLLLPLLAGVATFAVSRLAAAVPAPAPLQDERAAEQARATQRTTALVYPVVIALAGHFAPAALVLYWITGNAFAAGQQLVVNRILLSASTAASG
jgi:YidC/Oxa1 family membrane protein insertase